MKYCFYNVIKFKAYANKFAVVKNKAKTGFGLVSFVTIIKSNFVLYL